jgi:hypothetical protein
MHDAFVGDLQRVVAGVDRRCVARRETPCLVLGSGMIASARGPFVPARLTLDAFSSCA